MFGLNFEYGDLGVSCVCMYYDVMFGGGFSIHTRYIYCGAHKLP